MIPNIGAKRKNLLLYFQSIDELKNANLEKLCKVPGISKEIGEQIYNFFNEK